MPSIHKEFVCDVFVSYRQKDNRSNGWVTAFVDQLKKELEVTVKEQVHVYFDANITDGLLENHEVETSLNERLKCLIFIPIISQTYCDPKSFAWKNEFLPFIALSSKDQIGLKVKLRNGNYTSRVLPIRIHELEVNDHLLLEQELNGPLRAIDFIFKAPGVNRPLLHNEDHPHENQLHVFYRDQINKVANQIKEILQAIQSREIDIKPSTISNESALPKYPKLKKSLLIGLMLIAIFSIGILIFSQIRNEKSSPTTTKFSIAVLPFKLAGNDQEVAHLADGIQEAIRVNLSHFEEFRVKSRTSVERFKNITKSARDIARELGVNFLLEGTTQKIGNRVRIMVELFDEKADVIWSEQFDQKLEDIFSIQSQISESVAKSLKAKITPSISDKLNENPTQSFEAYDLYLKGKQSARQFEQSGDIEKLNLAVDQFKQAIKIDPQFAVCYGWLSGLALVKHSDLLPTVQDSIISLANKALAIDSSIVEADITLSQLYYALNDDVNALRFTFRALENELMDSTSTMNLIDRLGSIYSRIGDIEQALFIQDEVLKISPQNENQTRKKILTISTEHSIEKLTSIRDKVSSYNSSNPLINLVNFHLALEHKSLNEITSLYDAMSESERNEDWFVPYYAIFAYALKIAGRTGEGDLLIQKFKDLNGNDPYFQAQIELYHNRAAKAEALLRNETVGWYHLNLSLTNPLMEKIKNSKDFENFIQLNRNRLNGTRERIYHLEISGFLQKPFIFLQPVMDDVRYNI